MTYSKYKVSFFIEVDDEHAETEESLEYGLERLFKHTDAYPTKIKVERLE